MLFQLRCEACGCAARTLCAQCRDKLFAMPQPTCEGAVVAVAYEGIARRLILSLKYRNRRQVVPVLCALLAQRLIQHLPNVSTVCDVVTWAPTSKKRVRGRGHDQSELLARRLAKEIGVPCKRLLIKTSTNVQTGAPRLARLAGSVYSARNLRGGTHVIVVDDVVTTGTTMRCAANALREAGAQQVTCVAIASALRHGLRR